MAKFPPATAPASSLPFLCLLDIAFLFLTYPESDPPSFSRVSLALSPSGSLACLFLLEEGEMSRLQLLLPSQTEATTCGAMLKELQALWDEIGENDAERDKIILQLEQECLDLYRRKVNHTRKQKSDLCQTLAEAEAEISRLVLSLGERHESFSKMEKKKGTLKEQVGMIMPAVEDLRSKRDARLKQFSDVQSKIFQIQGELSGTPFENSTFQLFDEEDLSQRKLGELNAELNNLLREKNRRLEEVNCFITSIHDISNVISVDFGQTIKEVHPCFVDIRTDQSKSISDDTLAKFSQTMQSLAEEKGERLQKIQVIGSNLLELWKLMDTPFEEQKKFEFVTRLRSLSVNEVVEKGCLSMYVIDQAQMELNKLTVLKSGKMKELILKKQLELEAIYDDAHIDIGREEARKALCDVIESGNADLSELLSTLDDQIEKAREQAVNRKEILDKVEKWRSASQEELWLDDYERDHNRYNAVRGAHKNLKRAEKARKMVSKLQSIVEGLMTKIKAWEKERACLFLYDKERLLDILEEYSMLRHQREEEKRRSREQRKMQEQLATEQEMLFGSKRSPVALFSGKKPLGQSSHTNMNVNMAGGSCRILTPLSRHGGTATNTRKEKMRGKPKPAAIPVNFVALAKDNSFSPNPSVAPSP